MRTILSFLLPGMMLLLAQGCIFMRTIKGDGNVGTHTIDISDYNEIRIEASSSIIHYSQEESAPALTVTVDQNIFELFEFKTDDEALIIRPKGLNKSIRLRPTEFTITSNSTQLKKVNVAGAQSLDVSSKLTSNEKISFNLAGSILVRLTDTVTTDRMDVKLAGNGTFEALKLFTQDFNGEIAGSATFNLAGKGEDANFKIAGSGDIHAMDFILSDLSCEIAGSGLIETYAEKNINAKIAGSGNIRYKGDPSIQMKKAGIGSVKKVD